MNSLNDYIYFKTKNGILYHGDCREILYQLVGNSIDLIITDPPYNIGSSSKLCKKGNKIISNKEMFGHFEPTDTHKWYEYLKDCFTQFYRINKGSIYIFYDRFEITGIKDILEKIGYYPKNLLAIIKNNPLPHIRKNGFRSDFELCLFCQKNKGKDTFHFLSQQEMKSVDYYTIGNKSTSHPTEKPLQVIMKYVKISSNENDVVLDPFMGSGTTAIACENLNRKWIGIEKNIDYCEMLKERLGLQLFNIHE